LKLLSGNKAARILEKKLADCVVGLISLIDYCTIHTLDMCQPPKSFIELGLSQDLVRGRLEFDS
tara:strand:- start:14 stop:205 length:192 start_codon:yes stop_codon:yes gene_type:complete